MSHLRPREFLSTLILTTALFFCGCSSVTTPYPLSDSPQAIDREKLEGVWIAGEDAYYVKFSTNGVAQIAGIEWADEQFRLVKGEMVVVQGRTNNFLSVRLQENGQWSNEYHVASYTFTQQGDLVVWPPDTQAFQEAIATNALGGVVDAQKYSTHILLTNSADKIIDVINDPKNMTLFDYRNPIVLKRLSKPDASEK